jgi:hypothetical protein
MDNGSNFDVVDVSLVFALKLRTYLKRIWFGQNPWDPITRVKTGNLFAFISKISNFVI